MTSTDQAGPRDRDLTGRRHTAPPNRNQCTGPCDRFFGLSLTTDGSDVSMAHCFGGYLF